ncbi:hypothetical protein [Azospirillum sp. TSO22-1]|uniref:hypothetical protein n=1 Tax=Azospirillum sp. TSO22-1 TaxID=716789 RepID=UPI0018EEC1B3|nr:hypothetical protein [Azospirillum sp. TSO22-1]
MKPSFPKQVARGISLRTRHVALTVLLAMITPLGVVRAEAPEPALPPDLATVRSVLAKYKDPVLAVRDGYFSTLGCVHYKEGGMGVHFLNPQLIGPVLDPVKPQILVYEPKGGKLQLVAAEWFVPLATGITERPQLFGQPFDGPMEGHEPLIPKQLHHYDLHVWLFKANPNGHFATTNPDVSCDGAYSYSLLESAPAAVAHHKQ